MRKTILNFVKAHKFLVAIILTAVVKQLFVVGIPLYALPAAVADDGLLRNWAYSMSMLQWTGEFNCYTFMKEVGFSMFMAVIYRLHLSFLMTETFVYTVSVIVLTYGLKHVVKSRKLLYVIYVVLLFNPVTYALQTYQRAYRNCLGLALAVLVLGSVLQLYFHILDENPKQPRIWAIVTGLSLGFLWIVKSDTIWVMPLVIVVTMICVGMLFFRMRNKKSIRRYLMLCIPFLGIFLFSQFVTVMNKITYGYDGITYYGLAMSDLTSVVSDESSDTISLPRSTFEYLCTLSPTLATTKDEVEESMDNFNEYDTDPEDGNVEDGWIGWALISAFDAAGYYEDAESANNFYQAVYEELEAAYDSGLIEKKETTKLASYYLDTTEHRQLLLADVKKIFSFVTSFESVQTEAVWSDESGGLEELTHDSAIYEDLENDYLFGGWIVFHNVDYENAEVYVEDAQGNQYLQIEFGKSPDVYTNLAGTDYETDSAKKCRFQIGFDALEGLEDTQYYIVAYEDGECVGKVELTETGYEDCEDYEYKGSLDNIRLRSDAERAYDKAVAVCDRVNLVTRLYQLLGTICFALGIISYVVLTIAMLFGLRRKEAELVHPWLISTGTILSVVVLALGVAVIDLTQCPGISYMYLSSAYAFVLLFEMLNMVKCAEIILDKLHTKKQVRIRK